MRLRGFRDALIDGGVDVAADAQAVGARGERAVDLEGVDAVPALGDAVDEARDVGRLALVRAVVRVGVVRKGECSTSTEDRGRCGGGDDLLHLAHAVLLLTIDRGSWEVLAIAITQIETAVATGPRQMNPFLDRSPRHPAPARWSPCGTLGPASIVDSREHHDRRAP
ncbi:hypothetical protein [Nigerium massiliense]|uniref:hypothetical protein n=1 Tax=Nigerium massiliense TaxID=1522317 RepID=UPI0011CAD2C5|nr:hypothetical protein [Nigerium massiliense]